MLFRFETALAAAAIFIKIPSLVVAAPATRGNVEIHCGYNPLDLDQITAAFDFLASGVPSDKKLWMTGNSAVFGYDGQAQFYICNNAPTTRYYLMDDNAKQAMLAGYNECNGNSFWQMDSDVWSFGVDPKGNRECGL